MFNIFLLSCLYAYIFCFVLRNAFSTNLEVQQKSGSAVAELQLKQIYQQTKHMKYGKVI